jgi:hypothetical protein
MNREFVLRDNEVAINRPDGTVVIMNLNALRELQGDSNKDKEIADLRKDLAEAKARIERYKEANEVAVNAANNRLEKINDLKAEMDVLRKKNTDLEDKVSYVEGLKNGYMNKATKLEADFAALEERYESLKKKFNQPNQTPKQQLVLWGSVNIPKNIPDFMFVTSNGEVFFTEAEIERKYNLPKGSVSAYFADKQKFLYPRDCNGVRPIDPTTGDFERLGVVRRFTNSMFKNKDLNNPDISFINESIKIAIQFKNGELQ